MCINPWWYCASIARCEYLCSGYHQLPTPALNVLDLEFTRGTDVVLKGGFQGSQCCVTHFKHKQVYIFMAGANRLSEAADSAGFSATLAYIILVVLASTFHVYGFIIAMCGLQYRCWHQAPYELPPPYGACPEADSLFPPCIFLQMATMVGTAHLCALLPSLPRYGKVCTSLTPELLVLMTEQASARIATWHNC